MTDSPKRLADSKADGSNPSKKAKKAGDDKDKSSKKKNPEFELQRSLLESDRELSKRFVEGIRSKPEGITQAQFTRQFWAARQHLLRAHAFEKQQQQAMHNVFTEFKPREDNKAGSAPGEDNSKMLKITIDQIESVFRLHPVVRRAYNDSVPDHFKDATSFFRAFLTSRLYKKLRGERIREEDPQDPLLDRYLLEEQQGEQHVPHFIDLEGNEQNHSQRKGNQPDLTMRPGNSADKVVDVLRALNTTSARILADAGRTDGPAFAPIGLDEGTYNELRLHDLQTGATGDRVRLNVQDQQQLHADQQSKSGASTTSAAPTADDPKPTPTLSDPSKTLHKMQSSFQKATKSNSMDLESALAFPATAAADDADADDDDAAADPATAATAASLRAAAAHIRALVAQQASARAAGDPSARADPAAAAAAALHMDERALHELVLTLQTTNEFLRYFWALALGGGSGGSASMAEVKQIVGALDKSVARMDAAGASVEEQRRGRLAELQRRAAEEQQRLRRRVAVDEREAGPGREAVGWLMAPMRTAVDTAKARYKELARTAAAMTAS